MDLDNIRAKRLARAEWVDAWRVFPRLFVALYGILIYVVVSWFMSIKTYSISTCNSELFISLITKGVHIDKAREIACSVSAIVGGPTTEQTVLVTTICGLSAAIFSFYTSSGKDWSKSVLPWKFGSSKKSDSNDDPTDSPT